MSSVSTLIYQFLQTKFGDLDWEQGSVLRELVAEPIVGLAEQATQAVNAVYNSLNISALLDNPEAHSDAIDTLFAFMGLSEPSPTYSTGKVRLLISNNNPFTIPAGASFYYNDSSVSVPTTVDVGPDGRLKFTQLGYNTYAVDVDVSADAIGTSLGEGTELTWSLSNPAVYSATVQSAITGGVSRYTATQKINLIRQQLFPASLSCAEGFLKAINNYAANSAVDCLLSGEALQPTVKLYVKATEAPKTWQINVAGKSVGGNYTATFDGTGIAGVRGVVGGSILGTAWLGRNITITYSGDANAVVEVFGLPSLIDAQQALDNYTAHTGVVVDVQTPRLLQLEMFLPTSANMTNSDTINKLVGSVNGSLLNAAALGDASTQPIIMSAGGSLQGAGSYTLVDPLTGQKQTSIATINTTPFTDVSKPFAIYTTNDKITLQNA